MKGQLDLLTGQEHPCGPLYHCLNGEHCRCKSCHDAGPGSRFPDLSTWAGPGFTIRNDESADG